VADSPRVVAFHDLNPVAPVHVLIIPRDHIESLGAAGPQHVGLIGEMVTTAQELATELELDAGWRFLTNVGPDGGQSVGHLHFHLIGGRRMSWPPG